MLLERSIVNNDSFIMHLEKIHIILSWEPEIKRMPRIMVLEVSRLVKTCPVIWNVDFRICLVELIQKLRECHEWSSFYNGSNTSRKTRSELVKFRWRESVVRERFLYYGAVHFESYVQLQVRETQESRERCERWLWECFYYAQQPLLSHLSHIELALRTRYSLCSFAHISLSSLISSSFAFIENLLSWTEWLWESQETLINSRR